MGAADQGLDGAAQRLGVPAKRLDYLLHYDAERHVCYFETPKVACTSIKKYMQDTASGEALHYENKSRVHDRASSPIRPLSERSDDEVEAVFWGPVSRFTFVRNPYARLLSGYLDKIVNNDWERGRHLPLLGFERTARPSLLEFLVALRQRPEPKRDIHFWTQAQLVAAGDIAFDMIGRFECFDEDFHRLKQDFFGDSSVANYAEFGKHHASGASEKISQYFGAEEIALVREIYAPDFTIFGYSEDVADSLAPPVALASAATPALGATLARLRLPAFDPANPAAFRDAVVSAAGAGRLPGALAADLLARGARWMSEAAAMLASARDGLAAAGTGEPGAG